MALNLEYFKKYKISKLNLVLTILGFIILSSIVLFLIFSFSGKKNSNHEFVNAPPEITKAFDQVYRYLDGVEVSKGQENNSPVAVVVENQYDSRPQSGLDLASLVFEIPVEGEITRFLTFFDPQTKAEEIGPVRSARPYFLDLVKEFDSLFLHVGGSQEALEKIDTLAVNDLDQYYLYQYYWRDSNRLAPHNVYTSSSLINKALIDRNLLGKTGEFTVWEFKNDLPLEQRPMEISDINVNFSRDLYNVTWKYNRDNNYYVRYYGDERHLMKDGQIIAAKNLIIMITEVDIIDEVGRKKIKITGTGEAIVFLDGQIYLEAEWRKNKRQDRLEFFYQGGEEKVKFNRGQTWIEVVDENMLIEY